MSLHNIVDVVWKTVLAYMVLLAALRITGKREVGAFGPIDLASFIMMSEAAFLSITEPEMPLAVGLAPILVLGLLAWTLTYLSMKDHHIRQLLVGAPRLLVSHGRPDEAEMRRHRYTLGDLMAEMRMQHVTSLADVEFAILEHSGRVSIVPRSGARPVEPDDLRPLGVAGAKAGSALPAAELPATVVSDGQIDEDALRRVGHDRAWLEAELERGGHGRPADLFLVTLDGQGKIQCAHPRAVPDEGAPAARGASGG
jgi:uncharacterized membrane protein YcaP (DUF421 family)